MNLRCLDRFLERERWNDGRDAFGQHRFTRAGRSDHEDIVTASYGHFDGAFDVALAFHVAEIHVVDLMRRKETGQIGACRQKRDFAAQKGECLA